MKYMLTLPFELDHLGGGEVVEEQQLDFQRQSYRREIVFCDPNLMLRFTLKNREKVVKKYLEEEKN